MSNKPKIDVIVASYASDENTGPLEDCIQSVRAFTRSAVRLIVERSKQSAAVNRNRALEKSDADIICFLDDDAWVTPDWDAPLLKVLQSGDFQAVAPKIKLEDGRIFSCGLGFAPPDTFLPIGYGFRDSETYSSQFEVFGLPTTCMMVSRKALQGAKFCESYGSCQWEDVDFLMQMKVKGVRSAYCGYSTAYHKNLFRTDDNLRNRNLFTKTWGATLASRERIHSEVDEQERQVTAVRDIEKPNFELLREPFSGKPQVHKYHCSCETKVVRTCSLADIEAQKALSQEAWASRFLSARGLAPAQILDLIEIDGIAMASQAYVRQTREVLSKEYVHQLAAIAFAKLHSIPLDGIFHTFRILTSKHDLWSGGFEYMSEKTKTLAPRDRALCFAIHDEIRRRFERVGSVGVKQLAILHGDSSPGNFMVREYQGTVSGIFLDWSDVCLGDPALDLAKHAVAFNLDSIETQSFVGHYNSWFGVEKIHLSSVMNLLPICKVFSRVLAPVLGLCSTKSLTAIEAGRMKGFAWLSEDEHCGKALHDC